MKHAVKWIRPFFSVVLLFSVLLTSHSVAGATGLMQPATSANLKGIDVSHWQGTIDWNQVKNSGIAFAYAKVSQGTTYTDPMFSTNLQGARAAGLPFGAYHYASPSAPYNPDQAKAEAQYFVDVMKNEGMGDFGDIMPVLDLEQPAATGTLTSDEIASWARVFTDTVKSLTNRQVMVYTGDWFVEQYNDFGGKLSDLPVWIAAWTRYGNTQPPAVGGWTQWTAWQYSDQGSVPGVSGYVDLDYGPTSIDALRGYLTNAPSVPAVPSNFTANPTANSVQVSWSPSANASSYQLQRNGNIVYQGTATIFTDTGLLENTTYSYTLTAVNDQGQSSPVNLPVTTQATAQTVTNVIADKSQYNSGNYAKLITTAKDGNGNPLSGATVALTVKNPRGSITSVTGKTDTNGTFTYNYFISKNLRGTFNVTVTTTMANYHSSSASTTFSSVK
ncbi:GH25 family lysozyme [Neobacillus cucumis]|uniref:GH25 family lysozyme n=1 Tax=Neobacillus cucumis TaxID=1740721 RepID=UPI0015E114E6|nr:GH25 family lysozyme [Neobacillus cucumis]